MNTEFNITPQIDAHIKEMVKFLPHVDAPSKTPVFQQVYGSQVIERFMKDAGIDTLAITAPNFPKDDKGRPIRANKKYYASLGIEQIDHYKELTKAWKHGGVDECTKYIDAIKAKALSQINEKLTIKYLP